MRLFVIFVTFSVLDYVGVPDPGTKKSIALFATIIIAAIQDYKEMWAKP